MSKIFFVGLHKSGTTSFHKFALNADITSSHCPGRLEGVDYQAAVRQAGLDNEKVVDAIKPILERFTAHSDVPIAGLYRELDNRYPGSKFILFHREPSAWWKSLQRHWALGFTSRKLTPFEHVQYRKYLGNERKIIRLRDRDEVIAAYEKHNRDLRAHFAGKPFLDAGLNEPDLAVRLAEFLDVPVGEFPREKLMTTRLRIRRIAKNIVQRLTS